jgi:hypothetical protein
MYKKGNPSTYSARLRPVEVAFTLSFEERVYLAV